MACQAIVLSMLFACCYADIWQPYIINIGEVNDTDVNPTAITKIFDLFPDDFWPPIYLMNPTYGDIVKIPSDSPLVIITHSTDDSHVDVPFDGGSTNYTFMPIPPLDDPTYTRNASEVFFWGWPEPFPWLSDALIHPARSKMTVLYPYRNFKTVFIASCYSMRTEIPAFSGIVGLDNDMVTHWELADGSHTPHGRLGAALELYVEAMKVRRITQAEYVKELKQIRGTNGFPLDIRWAQFVKKKGLNPHDMDVRVLSFVEAWDSENLDEDDEDAEEG